mgnify:CR=1 FL=1
MNETRKRIRRLCAVIGGICLLFFAARVYAADGVIEVQLEDLKSQYSDREGVTLALYQVGEVSTYGEPSIDELYGIASFPHSAEETQRAAEQIASRLKENPLVRQNTDAGGNLVFSSLENGVYLIRAEASEKYGKISPILAFLPYYEVVDGEKKGPLYTLTVQPKASKPDVPKPPAESESESESQTENESESETESKPSGGSGGSGGTGGFGGSGGSGVKTGDDTDIAVYLMLFAAAGVIMAALLLSRKGKGASE